MVGINEVACVQSEIFLLDNSLGMMSSLFNNYRKGKVE